MRLGPAPISPALLRRNAVGARLAAFGASLVVEADEGVLRHVAANAFPGLRLEPIAVFAEPDVWLERWPSAFRLHIGGILRAIDYSEADAVRRLLSEVENELAAKSVDYVVVHAGVVAVEGRLVLLPGRSRAGKSTSTRALLERGAVYYSDDYALVSEPGVVWPYPRPLHVRGPERQTEVHPKEQGWPVSTVPSSASAVIFTSFVAGVEFIPRRLTSGEGVLKLLDHCLQAQHDPARALTALDALSRTAAFFEGPRGEAEGFAETVARLVSSLD